MYEVGMHQKAAGLFGCKAGKESGYRRSLFAWTANLITINRRKTLVIVHAPSHCMFLVHGVTAKMIPKIPKLINEGMEVLKDPSHPDFREISDWVNSCWWSPLNAERINIRIKNTHRRYFPVYYKIITTSKLVVCSAPIRVNSC